MLNEVKFTDLNNLKKVKTMDDVKKAAHSQGYEARDAKTHDKYGSHSTLDLYHRKSGERVKPAKDRGAIGGKKVAGGGAVDSTVVNTVSDAIKQDVRERGRKDKRPAAKKKRKAEAAANKAAKAKKRPGFGSKANRTFESFMYECIENEKRVGN